MAAAGPRACLQEATSSFPRVAVLAGVVAAGAEVQVVGPEAEVAMAARARQALRDGGSGGATVSALEQALEETGRADVYSIYFTFDSDEIREESERTIAEIADLMRKHPEWRLTINGHTDSVASDAYNLELSRRRAAATVNALTTRHGIEPSRFTFSGAGESSPKDTNDTLEGRAKNRRVELIRVP